MKCAEMSVTETDTITYAYDGQHRRVRTVVNGDTLWYFNAPSGQVLSEYDDSGWVSDFIYLNGQPLARIDSAGAMYFVNDHLGTPLVLVDDTLAVQWSADWYPFGTIYDETVSSENDIRFPGQWRDAESGLYYNWHRYYDPELGRYRQADPIGLSGGVNPYLYANGRPTNTIDPLGLYSWSEFWFDVKRGRFVGTGFGEEAVDYWACRYEKTDNVVLLVPGLFAALWTEDTWFETGITLLEAYGLRNAGQVWYLADGSRAYTLVDYGRLLRIEKHLIGRGAARARKWHVDAFWGLVRHWRIIP